MFDSGVQTEAPVEATYTGRFAPSPTGPLHAGSLVAALGSYLDARSLGGHWLIRIDDIDPPREVPDAAEAILKSLDIHGLNQTGSVVYQSTHSDRYETAITQLTEHGHIFKCTCSRSTLSAEGHCERRCQTEDVDDSLPFSLRVSVPSSAVIEFTDAVLGPQRFPLGKTCPNFIVRRKDSFYAYQLACAVDDGAGNVSHVVRGRDLLTSTPRQIFIQQQLGIATPDYAHLPILCDDSGTKLSKQTGAPPLDNVSPLTNLRAALATLGQAPPPADITSPTELLAWACSAWELERIPR